MAREIVMPQLNLSMDKGQIVNWRKQTGDKINPGDVLLEVESDKATVEVEAVEGGVLQIVLGPENGEISVGTVIAYLLVDGETLIDKASPDPLVFPKAFANPNFVTSPLTSDNNQKTRRLPSSPAARRRAAELNIDWRQVTGTGREGRIKERDVLRYAQETSLVSGSKISPEPSIQLSPVARRIADNFGLDELFLAKFFPGKTRFERADVEMVIRQIVQERQSELSPLAFPAADIPAKPQLPRRAPMGVVRKRIAERMELSKQTYAPVTLTTEIDATELVRLREAMKTDPHLAAVPSYNVLLAKIIAKALGEFPDLNASLDDREIVFWPTVNIGVAVDTERGLFVPVLRDVAQKSIVALSLEMNELLSRVTQGKSTLDDLSGGTFTITNLGVYDIDGFTPIINPPESAVLGVGRLRKQMIVVNDQPTVCTMLVLSLTFDHRLIDGAPAARFLQRVKQFCEKPYSWLT